jgi:hypothetical protein
LGALIPLVMPYERPKGTSEVFFRPRFDSCHRSCHSLAGISGTRFPDVESITCSRQMKPLRMDLNSSFLTSIIHISLKLIAIILRKRHCGANYSILLCKVVCATSLHDVSPVQVYFHTVTPYVKSHFQSLRNLERRCN